MKKRLMTLLLVACLCFANISSVAALNAAGEIPTEISDMAKTTGINYMRKVVASDPSNYGLASQEEAARLTLGNGYYVQYLGWEQIERASGDTISELVNTDIAEKWRFIIELDGVPKVYFTIGQENETFKIVGYGGLSDAFAAAEALTQQLLADKTRTPELLCYCGKYYFATEDEGNIVPAFDIPGEYEISTYGRTSSSNQTMYFQNPASFTSALRQSATEVQGTTGRGGGIFAVPTDTPSPIAETEPPYLLIASILAVGSVCLVLIYKHIERKKQI